MIYQHEITFPKNGVKTSLYSQEFSLPGGILRNIKIGFTLESASAINCALFQNEWKLLPATPDTFFSWAGFIFEFDVYLPLPQGFSTFSVRGWNESITQDHTAYWWFTVIPEVQNLQNSINQLTTPIPENINI